MTTPNAKKDILLRGLSAQDADALRRWASDEMRSVNGQLLVIVHEALVRSGRLKSDTPVDLPQRGRPPKD